MTCPGFSNTNQRLSVKLNIQTSYRHSNDCGSALIQCRGHSVCARKIEGYLHWHLLSLMTLVSQQLLQATVPPPKASQAWVTGSLACFPWQRHKQNLLLRLKTNYASPTIFIPTLWRHRAGQSRRTAALLKQILHISVLLAHLGERSYKPKAQSAVTFSLHINDNWS